MHKAYCLGFAALLMGAIPFASAEEACVGGGGEDASSALRVAYEHFDHDLSKTMRVGSQEGLKGFLARMENYQIKISLEGDHYTIRFTPSTYPGGTVKGGGAEYIIRKCSHTIERVRPYM
ncbi:hypothetical protein [Stenotrophomonas sp. GZD-301]|uniref:hypothetical protein n=1 Tax=Stenotrophomonas sp. GZD-301 TaxID=3404814 RepID=UPI003BB784A9